MVSSGCHVIMQCVAQVSRPPDNFTAVLLMCPTLNRSYCQPVNLTVSAFVLLLIITGV